MRNRKYRATGSRTGYGYTRKIGRVSNSTPSWGQSEGSDRPYLYLAIIRTLKILAFNGIAYLGIWESGLINMSSSPVVTVISITVIGYLLEKIVEGALFGSES